MHDSIFHFNYTTPLFQDKNISAKTYNYFNFVSKEYKKHPKTVTFSRHFSVAVKGCGL